ncbi:putative cell division protein FtsL [Bacillus sp. TS-2]|nr:putative cell division protein FtsL [Bacillus sp. TS-2]
MSMIARQIQHQEQLEPKRKKKIVRRVRHKLTLGEKSIIGILILSLFVVGAIIVNNYVEMYRMNQDIYQLEQVVAEQSEINGGLYLQVLELSNPDRILQLAKESGMGLNEENVNPIQQQN